MVEKQTTEEILSEVEAKLRNAGIIPHDLEMEVGGEYSFWSRLGRDTVLARANAAGFKCSPLIGGDYLITETELAAPPQPNPVTDATAGDAATDASWTAHVTDPVEQLKWAEVAIREANAHIEAQRRELTNAREALERCINADVIGYWSPEEVAKRFFAAYPK